MSAVTTTAPYWWDAAPPQERSDPLPATVDVAIVGAGYTGLAAALTLARAGRQVAVLDAERPGEGASSRNGGMIGSGHRVGFAAASERYGTDLARRLLAEGNNALAYTTRLIEREAIACHYVRSGRFRGAWNAQHYAAMERELDTLRREIGLDATLVPKEQVSEVVATPHYQGGCIFHQHGGLHPGLFHRGLLERAEATGATVHGRAPVLEIAGAQGRHRLTTPRGTVEAGEVIVATNGYTRPGTPYFSQRVVPAASYLVATEEIGENRVRALIPGGRMIVETRARHCYYRASPDGRRLLLGARPALRNLDPRRTLPTMRRLLEHLFPELSGVGLTHAWSGLVGMSRDSLPHLGRHAGRWYALGYSGSGVAMAPYLGHKVALRLLGDPEGETPFEQTPFPAVPFFSGQSWFLAPLELWYRVKDWREGSP